MLPQLQPIAARIKDARLRLIAAQNYTKCVLADGLDGPDGSYASQRAIQAENEALRDYAGVLREYSECLGRIGQRPKT